MPLETSPEALTERLYVLTLALAEAADRADADELTALFDARERVIGQLASSDLPLSVLPRLESIQAAERTTLARLEEIRSAAAHSIGREARANQIADAYRLPAHAVVFEAAS